MKSKNKKLKQRKLVIGNYIQDKGFLHYYLVCFYRIVTYVKMLIFVINILKVHSVIFMN